MASEKARRIRWENHYTNVMDRFWARVDMSAGLCACWPWTGCVKPNGYGFIMHRGKAVLTHRVALFGMVEGLPKEMACHKCDNPICCNPDHLFRGDATANNYDCFAKGRRRGPERKMDPADVVAMRGAGAKYEDIAQKYRVNQASVGKLLKREQRLTEAAAILKAKETK